MRIIRLISWILVVAVGTVALYALLVQPKPAEQKLAFGGPFEMVTTSGAPFTHEDLAGKPYAIFFGFTHCPDVCPTTLADIAYWRSELGEEATKVPFYFVSVDPERDTPEFLASYLSPFPSVTGLTGTQDEVDHITSLYKIYAKKVPLDNGGYTMDHTASVILIDGDGNFFATIAYQENPQTAVEKLRRLASQSQ